MIRVSVSLQTSLQDLLPPRIVHTLWEAARHLLRDKAHATRSNRSLHHTTFVIRFAAHLGTCSKHRLMRDYHGAILHVSANWHTKLLVGGKGHNQTLGKTGKIYPKASPYSVDELESPAGAVAAPLRHRKIDYSHYSQRLGRVLVNLAGAVAVPLHY